MFLDSAPSQENRLQLSDTFTFSCHKDLACFNTCCREKHLPLTPYDALRLKNSLDLHSDDFLSQYVVYRLDPDSGFPVLSLKMGDGPERPCPFVTDKGCMVYNDRPTACRLFPLGSASGKDRDQIAWNRFFHMLDIPGCLGLNEDKVWTVSKWRDNQGLSPYLEMNDKMLEILFHPKRDRKKPLDDNQLRKIMVVCYNPDIFREFVFNTKFLESYEINDETGAKVKQDDKALLTLGIAYLGRTLFS